jgi:hypothetical protein
VNVCGAGGHMAIEKELLHQLLVGRDPNEVFAKNVCLTI